MRRSLGIAAVAVVALIVGVSADALATPATGFVTSQISLGRFDAIDVKMNADLKVKIQTKGESDVYVVSNTVSPGGSSGWHTHPGPSLITIKSGTATFYDGDDPTCSPKVYTAGQGVIDPGDGHVHVLRNEGTVDLVTVTVQFIPAGAPRRIEVPAPGNCRF